MARKKRHKKIGKITNRQAKVRPTQKGDGLKKDAGFQKQKANNNDEFRECQKKDAQ